MIPVYLAMLAGAGASAQPRSRWRLLMSTTLFVTGFVAVFTVLGLGASSVGGFLQAHRGLMLGVGGALIVLFGLRFLGVLRFSWLEKSLQLPASASASSAAGALLFGVVFALGWTPCVGPILGAVLTYAATSTTSPAGGALLLFAYGLGVGAPLIVLSLAADRLMPRVRKLMPLLPKLEKGIGVAMLAVGLMLLVPEVLRKAGNDEAAQASAVQALATPAAMPRIIEFRTPKCPVCERMAPRVAQLRKECEHHDIEIVEVDLSDRNNAELARQFQITGVPSFGLVRPDGTLAGKLVGEQDLATLRSAAANLGAEGCGEAAPLPVPSAPGVTCATEAPQCGM
jgi:cytochrome c-type biogenesis protein